MNHTLNLKTHGRYKMIVRKADGSIKKELEFDNVITDIGLDKIFTSGSAIEYFSVGTGTNTPATTDTAMQTPLARQGRSGGVQSNSGNVTSPWVQSTYTARFAAGTATGNLTEIGIGWGGSAPQINTFSRALIVDGAGVPTTLTILSDEVLDVFYYFRMYIPTTDVTGTIVDSVTSVSYSYVLRAANCLGWDPNNILSSSVPLPAIGVMGGGGSNVRGTGATLGTIYTAPTGGSGTATVNWSSGTTSTYVAGTFINSATATLALTTANATGGIVTLAFTLGPFMDYQISFSPAVPKDATKTLTLSFSLAITRYSP